MTTEQPSTTADKTALDVFATYQQACTALGGRLADYRKGAGLTRQQFAATMGRSLATVRRAETGQSLLAADFWRTADHHLGTGGVLAKAWVSVAELKRAADTQNAQNTAIWKAAGQCLSPHDCLCRVAVAHWAQPEIRALRMAMRLGFPEWATAMHTNLETVYGWEHPRGPMPRLEDQRQFDELIENVALDVRARFRLLLTSARGQPATDPDPDLSSRPAG